MKQSARRIYNRLIVDSPKFNTAADHLQNIFLAFAALAAFAVVSLVGAFAAGALAEWLTQSGYCPDTLLGIVQFIAEWPWVLAIAIGALSAPFVLKGLSQALFERSGELLIWRQKLLGGEARQNELLDIVEAWLTTQPDKVRNVHEFLFDKSPEALMPKALQSAIEQQLGAAAAPVVVVRHFAERKYWPLYASGWFYTPDKHIEVRDPQYFRNARGYRNAIRVSLLFDALGAELRDEISGGHRWRRNYITKFKRQHTALFDANDIPLRFRTAAPHYRWPYAARKASTNETAIFRVVMCLENPTYSAFHVISVDEVIACIPDAIARLFPEDFGGPDEASRSRREKRTAETLKLLQDNSVAMYGKRSRSSLQQTSEGGLEKQPVLRNFNEGRTNENGDPLAPDWGLKWDTNFIDWSDLDKDTGGEILAASPF